MAERPGGRSSDRRARASVANQAGLAALGDTVDGTTKSPTKRAKRVKRTKSKRSLGVRIAKWTSVVVVVALVLGIGGGYLYFRYEVWGQIKKFHAGGTVPRAGNDPFNVLLIGSDSRAGLTGSIGSQTGAGSVSGQRSDAIKIIHINPQNHTVTMISIPRDTLVKLLANQDLYTNYNRINVNYGLGPTLLVKTIEANFGIPINHVVQVTFTGLIDAADALGGVWLDFPYPAKDAYSGLRIHQAGCQLVKGFQALAVVRARHYEYEQNGVWYYDGTSDFGRIQRQDTFIRAMMDAAKSKISIGNLLDPLNAVALSSFVSQLTQGISIDSTWTSNETLQLAYDFKSFSSSSMKSYTLPVVSDGYVSPYGDVLSEQEPEAQQLLVKIFGAELMKVKDPPPNGYLEPLVIPNIKVPSTHSTTTSSTSGTTSGHSGGSGHSTVTTTTQVPAGYDYFNPVPCTPR